MTNLHLLFTSYFPLLGIVLACGMFFCGGYMVGLDRGYKAGERETIAKLVMNKMEEWNEDGEGTRSG